VADILLGIQQLNIWVRATNTTLSAAVTATSDSTLTLASGTALANASAVLPTKLMVDNEIFYATTPGTTPTVLRGRDGTTAATHAISATAKVLQPVHVPKVADWTPNTDIQDIAIPGDGSVEHIFRLQGLTGALTANKWAEEVLKIAMGCIEQTTGIYSDMADWMHPELGAYPLVEMHVNLVALDGDNNNATITKRIILWRTQLQNPFIPAAAGNNALQGTPVNWSSEPTTTDLWGRSIPGATKQIHYTIGNVA
jgi:hypothetical protein